MQNIAAQKVLDSSFGLRERHGERACSQHRKGHSMKEGTWTIADGQMEPHEGERGRRNRDSLTRVAEPGVIHGPSKESERVASVIATRMPSVAMRKHFHWSDRILATNLPSITW